MPETPINSKAIAGLILCRIIVPAWILTGAVFKLVEANPGLLPRNLLIGADRLAIDLDLLLAILISLECLIAAVMIFMDRLARPAAIFQLSVFVLVLIGEIAAGRTDCGCLGANSPSPWTMLGIDVALLLGVVFLKPPVPAAVPSPLAALGFAAAASVVTFSTILDPAPPTAPRPLPPAAVDPGPADQALYDVSGVSPDRPEPLALPSYWFEGEYDDWIGRHWTDISLFRYMSSWPRDIAEGTRYVVFYSRTCAHCRTMFEDDLAPDAELASRVTAIEVPESDTALRGEDPWPMPATGCEFLELPTGVDWLIAKPLALRFENGILRCAQESDHRGCFGLADDHT